MSVSSFDPRDYGWKCLGPSAHLYASTFSLEIAGTCSNGKIILFTKELREDQVSPCFALLNEIHRIRKCVKKIPMSNQSGGILLDAIRECISKFTFEQKNIQVSFSKLDKRGRLLWTNINCLEIYREGNPCAELLG
jgi:hypothetical protein